MTALLPASLAPWRAWLDWFDPEIAGVLGELLLRLDRMVGPASARLQQGALEPDGVDDLRQRGPYERLVLSEWAIADALPDEFLRRAVSHEHLFLAPRLVARKADARIVAVFDAGPAQWGASRLVHVALWILLARRAHASGARFQWGLAHEPGILHDAGESVLLQRLLRGRTHEIATSERLHEWNAELSTLSTRASEAWWVAAPVRDLREFTHAVLTRRGFDGRLHVAAGAARALRRSTLDTPDGAIAGRLLRGHFLGMAEHGSRRSAGGHLTLQQPPLISTSGQYIAMPLRGESRAVVFKVQDEGTRKQASPRYHSWATGSGLLCGAVSEKTFAGLIADEHYLHFWKMPGFRPVPRPPAEEFTVTPGLGRWLRCAWLNGGGKPHRFAVLDHAGRLLQWSGAQRHDAPQIHQLIDDSVIALAQVSAEHAVYACYASGQLILRVMHRDGRTTDAGSWTLRGKPHSVSFCTSVALRAWHGAFCVEMRADSRSTDRSTVCRLYVGSQHAGFSLHELSVAGDCRLLGLVASPTPRDARLLVLQSNRRTVVAIGPDGAETLYQSGADVVSASVSIDGRRVALVTLDGQLVVLSEGGRRLMNVASGTEPRDD